jgi:hypothetical protein
VDAHEHVVAELAHHEGDVVAVGERLAGAIASKRPYSVGRLTVDALDELLRPP